MLPMSLHLAYFAIGLVVVGACGSEAARHLGITDATTTADGARTADSALIEDSVMSADDAPAADSATTAVDAVDAVEDITARPLCLGQPMPGTARDSIGTCPDPSAKSACMTCQGLVGHPECLSLCSFYSICWECLANGWKMSSVGCPRSCGDGGALQPGAVDAPNTDVVTDASAAF